MDLLAYGIATVSILLNVALFLVVIRQKKRPPSRDAQELLHELTRGKATVNIQVLDPDLLFTWKPRG